MSFVEEDHGGGIAQGLAPQAFYPSGLNAAEIPSFAHVLGKRSLPGCSDKNLRCLTICPFLLPVEVNCTYIVISWGAPLSGLIT
jgi:hypothetical protein